ncbi:MAG: hypothetical protein ACTSWY_01230 [Promethearchaeota archaeon]
MPKKNPKHRRKYSIDLVSVNSEKKNDENKGKKFRRNSNICNVKGCNKKSVHSLSLTVYQSAINGAGLELINLMGSRKFKICKIHYKKIKKIKKSDEKMIKPKKFQNTHKKMKQPKIKEQL